MALGCNYQGSGGPKYALRELSSDVCDVCCSRAQPHAWHDVLTGHFLQVHCLSLHLLSILIYRPVAINNIQFRRIVNQRNIEISVGKRS